MKNFAKKIFKKKIIIIWTVFDVLFLFILIPLGFIISEMENKISGLSFLCFDFIAIFIYILFIRFIHIYRSELQFEVFTIFFMVGSFLGIIVLIFQMIEDLYTGSLLMFFMINIFFTNLYARFYLWEKFENRLQKKKKDV
jgi:hypothetical protein